MGEQPIFTETHLLRSHWFWLAIVAAVCLFFAGCGQDPYQAVCEIIVDLPDTDDDNGGSGSLISVADGKGLVLTASHVCVQEGYSVILNWPTGETTQGVVYKMLPGRDYTEDQALVVCHAPKGITPLRIGKYDPEAGPIVSVGWRTDKDGTGFYEAVAFDAYYKDGLIHSSQPFIGGMSGGPTLQNGVIVGVAVGSNRKDYSVSSPVHITQ